MVASSTGTFAVAGAVPNLLFSRRSAALLEGNAATGDPVWTVALRASRRATCRWRRARRPVRA